MAGWRATCFLTGLAAIYLVLLTRFEYLAQHMFFLNRIQHAVMHHLGPFLIAVSWPGATIARGMPAAARRCCASVAVRLVLGVLQQPAVAVLLFEGLLVLWLIPPVTFRAMLDPRLYAVMNASMVVDGLLFWFLVLDPRPNPPAPVGFFTRATLAFLIIFPQIAVGTLIGMSPHDLYPSFALCGRVYSAIDPLLDQQIGGLILWVPTGMMSALATGLIMCRLCLHDATGVAGPGIAGDPGGTSMKVRSALTMAAAALLLIAPAGSRAKIPDDKIKIGILQDQPEPVASGNRQRRGDRGAVGGERLRYGTPEGRRGNPGRRDGGDA